MDQQKTGRHAQHLSDSPFIGNGMPGVGNADLFFNWGSIAHIKNWRTFEMSYDKATPIALDVE